MIEVYLAGGCFWGVEAYFSNLDGVIKTEVGYANGKTATTTYEELKVTGFAETVKVTFDEEIISLNEIFEHFYYIIDPTSLNKQGNDVGSQYRTGIYSRSEAILKAARNFLNIKQEKEKEKIMVEVKVLNNYIRAEEYHQDYLKKNPAGYCHINLDDVLEI
ncbi:peptide-methionine (S)-S-oxide reductase MsrA [Anaerococcus sp. NML200574]|uniref:Peptide methionine sulfoxide reductase MsrA n=1 Tax=Anaerococcus kampingae TaxID=3115614 RepID=A0ABW9MDP1_9FIRM|nr:MULTISPECIES: peptide-methionine (S)-S-oxide reductase MsrA [unclassified Anaerococcus]MCW6679312.1 peptide-methionine (S)-S-oxide reductase MsrA [Anaerococcus sp. NML200574]MCW6701074.1 peptide-methionine (S)-S-oxide reductase MsrA [Anaerococcus sp. NML200537]